MPSKFGEFRFVGSKGSKSRVTFQAHVQTTSGSWVATTKQVACQAGNEWILNGFALVVKDGGTWKAQSWNDSAPKRILVRVQGDDGSDIGLFVLQDDAHNQPVVGCSLALITDSDRHAFCLQSASTAIPEQASTPVAWNTGPCLFLADPP